MNGCQRYLATLEGRAVDFPARTPILMQFAAERIGSDYAQFASDYRVLVEANLACARDFGIDQLNCISDPYRKTSGFAGNMDPVRLIRNGKPDEIRAVMREARSKSGTAYLVNAGCEIPSGTPRENLAALCQPMIN